jgi:hypothetical protein
MDQVTYLMFGRSLVLWIIAYSIWNWNFVVQSFSSSIAIYHISVLSTPLLICLGTLNPALWLLMRGISLIVGGSFQIAYKKEIEKNLKPNVLAPVIRHIKTPAMQGCVAGLTVLFCVASLM